MFEAASASLLGNRKINQDRCAILSNEYSVLLLLSDGLGGHPKGEVAAQIFMDTGRISFSSNRKPITNPYEFLARVLRSSHESIVAFGNKHNPPISPRATAVIALIQDNKLFWCHVGDSRLYLFRNQKIIMRTRDHSVVEVMRNRNKLLPEISTTKYRNLVTHCLGGTGRVFSVNRNDPIPLLPLDMLLLCTDGLWNQFTDAALGAKMQHLGSLDSLTAELARYAEKSAAPKSDNVSLIILRWLPTAVIEAESQKVIHKAKHESKIIVDDVDSELRAAINTLQSAIDAFSADK